MALMSFTRRARVDPATTPEGFYKGPPASDGPGWFWTPRVVGPHDYPLDLDGSTRITNPRRGLQAFIPFPGLQMLAEGGAALMRPMIPILPQGDAMVLAMGIGRMPSGPTMGLDPVTEDLILSDTWMASGQGGPMDIGSAMLPQIPKSVG